MADSVLTKTSSVPVVSRSVPACSLAETTALWGEAAWPTIKANIAQCIGAIKAHIYPFGVVEPWASDAVGPLTATPDAWTGGGYTINAAMNKMREVSPSIPIILTMYSGNWWNMAKLSATGGVTTAKTRAERYDMTGRMTNDGLADWGILIDELLDRYAANNLPVGEYGGIPFNVRNFEVWNELKGYYSVPAGTGQTYDARYASGTGSDARMGYSYFYEWTADRIVTKMTALGIPRSEYFISGPYSQNTTRGDVHADNVGAAHYLYQFNPYWGYADKAPINACREFLGHVRDQAMEFDVLSIDSYTGQKAGSHPTADNFDRTRKVNDHLPYYRASLAEYGFDPDMPIDYSELGVPGGTETEMAAHWADTLCNCWMNRVRYAMMWGATNAALDADGGLVNRTTGAMLKTGLVFKFFKDHFGPGARLFRLGSSDGATAGMMTNSWMILYNKTDQAQVARFNTERIALAAKETKMVKTPVKWPYARRG